MSNQMNVGIAANAVMIATMKKSTFRRICKDKHGKKAAMMFLPFSLSTPVRFVEIQTTRGRDSQLPRRNIGEVNLDEESNMRAQF